jgi:hypothetical protein
MKKFYLFPLLLSLGGLSSAWAQSVKQIGADFNTGAVTFTVDVNADATTPTWVLVEYTTASSPNLATMSRATFTDVSITPSSAGTLAAEDRGFLLESSATITAKLSDVSGKFSWCAYVFDAPPNATVNPGSGYTLRGTPPFIINNSITVNSHDFGAGTCIESITDFTYNPSGRIPESLAITVSASAFASETDPCAAAAVTFTATASGGTTDAMTYIWNIAGQPYITASNTYSLPLSTVVNNTYTVHVINANGCTSTVSNMGTVTMESVIETRTVNAILGYPPRTYTPNSLKASVCENTTYEWRRSGTGGDVTLMDSDELAYDIKKDVYAINTPGTYYYRRYATLTAGTIPIPAEGTYTLKVFAPPPSPSGTTTYLHAESNMIWTDAVRVDVSCATDRLKDRGTDYGYYYYYTDCFSSNATSLCVALWRLPDGTKTAEWPPFSWFGTPGWIPAGQYGYQTSAWYYVGERVIWWGAPASGHRCSQMYVDSYSPDADCNAASWKQVRCIADYDY